jgi:hypothetical protein
VKTHLKFALSIVVRGILLSGIAANGWAAPNYVTAWPRQVPVEKPDPVLGDRLFWESWVYGEEFAKRFKGFPIEKADAELKEGLVKAIALRIFKTNLWQGINPSFPEQYACEWDIYFDSHLQIPLQGGPKRIAPWPYPNGVSGSYKRLDAYAQSDRQAIEASKSASSNPKIAPLVFAVPLDGRYKTYRVREYHPRLTNGLALLVMQAGEGCEITTPLQEHGSSWLSLLGDRPYSKDLDGDDQSLWLGMEGSFRSGIRSVFASRSILNAKGYFRVPETFSKGMLPKVALVKSLNICITQRHSYYRKTGIDSQRSVEKMFGICRDAEEQGVVRDIYSGKDELQDLGY